MKKFLLLLIVFLLLPLFGFSQSSEVLPLNPKVKVGKLANGLTYYICPNQEPKDMANFYLVSKVGSSCEDNTQKGLAHFVEHLNFEQSKSLNNKVREKLLSWNVANFNANTSFYQTVYLLENVPSQNKNVTDSCLILLKDWSNAATFTLAEVVKQKSIIHEEWRTANTPFNRLNRLINQKLFAGSVYSDVNVLGDTLIIDNLSLAKVKEFYNKWYRPDLQAVVVVGDVDVAQVEQKIKTLFSSIAKPKVPMPKMPDYNFRGKIEPSIAIFNDKEKSMSEIQVFFNDVDFDKKYTRHSPLHYVNRQKMIFACNMLSHRLEKLKSKSDCPYAYSNVQFQEPIMGMQSVVGYTICKGDNVYETSQNIYREIIRAQKHGFNQDEFDRIRGIVFYRHDLMAQAAQKANNTSISNSIINYFAVGDNYPDFDLWYSKVRPFINEITVDDVNQFFGQFITKKNLMWAMNLPILTTPTEDEIIQLMQDVDDESLSKYQTNQSKLPLIEDFPKSGKIVSIENSNGTFDKLYTLSNGMKVQFKKTDFEKDQVVISVSIPKGINTLPVMDNVSLRYLTNVRLGIGNYSNVDIRDYLSGKNVSITTQINEYYTNIIGNSTLKDVQTAFELVHVLMRKPYVDKQEFDSDLQTYTNSVKVRYDYPDNMFDFEANKFLFNDIRKLSLISSDVEKIDYTNVQTLFNLLLIANPNIVNVGIAGNIDEAQIKPLIEKYLASLTGKKVKYFAMPEPNCCIKLGCDTLTFSRKLENPQTFIRISMFDLQKMTTKTHLLRTLAIGLINQKLFDALREKLGATYGGQVNALGDFYSDIPVGFMLDIPIKPELYHQSMYAINTVFDQLIKKVDQKDVDAIKTSLLQQFEPVTKQNSFWASYMSNSYIFDGRIFSKADIQNTTAEDVRSFIEEIYNSGNLRVIVMKPE